MTGTGTVEAVFEAADEIVLKDGASIGNVHRSLDFIPGSSIRGALAGRWLQRRAADDEFVHLFDTAVSVGDATPMSQNGQRTMPIPWSLQRCKAGCPRPTVVDRIHDVIDADGGLSLCPNCSGGFKPMSGYLTVDGSVGSCPLVPRGQTAAAGGTAEEGMLRYREAIPAGSRFVSAVGGSEESVERFLERCDVQAGLRLRVGESRSTRGALELVELRSAPTRLFDEKQEMFAVVMRSRAIVVDLYLRPDVHPYPLSLEHFPLTFDGTEDPIRWMAPPAPVAGWNGGQGIPKPVDLALPAGSAFLYELLTPAVARQEGVGLRRAEGFGEVELVTPEEHAGLRTVLQTQLSERQGVTL